MNIQFRLNGKDYNMNVDPAKKLIDFLRDDLGLLGTKEGCGEGECGSCTIIVDGKAVSSCLMLSCQIKDREVMTIEGLAGDVGLDRLQKSFIEKGAVQCGYCTSGMLMSSKALLLENSNPTVDEINTAIEGNLCRCTGYNKIVDAISDAANIVDEK
jgi:carbon-monoxide dehydrogenase small subunit